MNKYTIILHKPDNNNKQILHEFKYKVKAHNEKELNSIIKEQFGIEDIAGVVIEQNR